MLIFRWLTRLKLPLWTPSQWFQLCTSSVELLGVHGEVGGDTNWLRMLPSVLRKGKVEQLTPASWPAWHTPAGRCRLAASAGPPPWPAGSLQTSNLWWAPPALWGERGRDGRSARATSLIHWSLYSFEMGTYLAMTRRTLMAKSAGFLFSSSEGV